MSSVSLSISKPTPIDPLALRPLANRCGRFSFGERIVITLKNLIRLIEQLFAGAARKKEWLGLEMVSTGTSKLERAIQPIWADDEGKIQNTLRNGDILVVMGKGVDPRVKAAQLLMKATQSTILATKPSYCCEHTCMYVKDKEGKEWIVESSPAWVEKDKTKKAVKLLGEGARKVPFKEHALFLHLTDPQSGFATFAESRKKDVFVKVIRHQDANLAEVAASVALSWSSVSKINLERKADQTEAKMCEPAIEAAQMAPKKNAAAKFFEKHIIRPGEELLEAAENSFIRGYSYLGAGFSVLFPSRDTKSQKKEFLKWAFLSNFPPKKGEELESGQFCSMFTVWTIRTAESRKLLLQLASLHLGDAYLQFIVKAIKDPQSESAMILKNKPEILDLLIDEIFDKYENEINSFSTLQLHPRGATPSRFFDYAKANPEDFQEVASIISKGNPSLPQPVGFRVQRPDF